jgi:adenosylhomocysteine nucleosidase
VTRYVKNSGVATLGGTTNINAPAAIGTGAVVYMSGAQTSRETKSVDVGIITVIAEEAAAVRIALSLEPAETAGISFDVGTMMVRGKSVTLAATRALAQGQESAVNAYHHLREHFAPAVIVLTGIAGGIHRDVQLGDVVVATRVICYDLRKETPSGTLYRGQERQAPALIGHAVKEFFTSNGEPAELPVEGPGSDGVIRVLNGPIGTGNAVIANRDSEVIKYLARFNDKVLAVDMEAGGLSQAHHEGLSPSGRPLGWLVIRGISDDASQRKNDDYHHLAARNAALVLRELLPYLLTTPSGSQGVSS